MYKLQFQDRRQDDIELSDSILTFGRVASNAVVLDDEQVSNHHAQLEITGEDVILSDLGSQNGTFVNGERIMAPRKLTSWDIFSLNDVGFQLIPLSGQEYRPFSHNPLASKISPVKKVDGWALKADSESLPPQSYSIATIRSFASEVFPIDGKVIVGREQVDGISLPFAKVSRTHAELFEDNGNLFIRDLDSTNGTFVNGVRVTELQLKSGDEVCFDKVKLKVLGPDLEEEQTVVKPAETFADQMTEIRLSSDHNTAQLNKDLLSKKGEPILHFWSYLTILFGLGVVGAVIYLSLQE